MVNQSTSIASSKLQLTATSLRKIIDNNKLNDYEYENLRWAGILFGQLDWLSPHFGESLEASLLATDLRPSFYEGLMVLGINLDRDYSERAYQFLYSKGKGKQLNKEEVSQMRYLFQDLADVTLIACEQHNLHRC